VPKVSSEELRVSLQRHNAEREAEWEAVKQRFPINPNDPPEKQKLMRVKQQAAMLDP